MDDIVRVVALPILFSMAVVAIIHPWLVRIAKLKNIVDNPNARKLNKEPIPTLGGVAVFLGVIFGLGLAGYYIERIDLQFEIIIAMMIMLYTGVGDDILELSPRTRFLSQIFTVCLMMFLCGIYIDDFHGLWGIYALPRPIAVVLTILSCVGIINAINLIDGVDGLCSGYGMFASLLFAICFLRMGDVSYAVFAFTTFGALIPFWLHNTFGKSSKMFLGDGGSLILGFICSLFVTHVVQSGQEVVTGSTISLTLAVLAVPVFDTLRVMTARIIHGTSPFHPDKTHLHHLMFDLHFSHIGTTVAEILANLCVVGAWFLSYKSGASIDVQLYIVMILGFLITFGFYQFARRQERNQTKIYHFLIKIGDLTNVDHKKWFACFTRYLDKGC
jgi:UDP-N-acetylmuramyl pentapeptide phosphotransferase/UDP-N-acetylglucosamine-1-phosphate transferase